MQSFKTSRLQKSIIKTLVYADIFNYPLTSSEVWKFLIRNNKITVDIVREHLQILTDLKQIFTDGKLYFLKGRRQIVELRKEREEYSRKKLKIAQNTANKLKIIPTIKMIGVTGALAMSNCTETDDIDFLIITSKNTLWLTRLLIILLSLLLGIKRRKPEERDVKNKICFNLFLEENHLRIEPENLFLAHEIAQVKPIFDKENTYDRFLWENKWVKKFLPNSQKISSIKSRVSSSKKWLLFFLNILAFRAQFWYMKSKITVEKINLHQAFFHPNDLGNKIMNDFNCRCRVLGLDNFQG